MRETTSPAEYRTSHEWCSPPDDLRLPAAGEVHVWRVGLEPLRAAAERWRTILSPVESERADRFHFARDRETWLITRGMLRHLLGRYLNRAPSTVEFVYSATGKPRLDLRNNSGEFQFNVSHSGQCSLLAFALGFEVGIDVEYCEAGRDLEELGPTVMSAGEVALLRRLPARQRDHAFLAAWTRKESILKALGTGLSVEPRLVEVTFEPNEPAALLRAPESFGPVAEWSLRAINAGDEYSAAVAARARNIRLKLWDSEKQPASA
jgi:4'-phosphopantetheinyl transferase